jgi:putative ABC transport system permease protein
MSQGSVREILGERAVPSLFFVAAEGGEPEAREVATRLQGELFRNGVEADTFRALVEEFQGANLQFFRLMQAYLALGLVVGIAGLGVVMVRSVRERRREIGVLRAIGFVAPQVRNAFLSESAFTALQGIVVGTALALVTAAQLVDSGEFGESAVFTIPWTDVGILTGAALVASLLATAWPARQASRIPPAVALRTAE